MLSDRFPSCLMKRANETDLSNNTSQNLYTSCVQHPQNTHLHPCRQFFSNGDEFILHTLLISTMHQRTAEDFGSHSQTVFLRSASCWWRINRYRSKDAVQCSICSQLKFLRIIRGLFISLFPPSLLFFSCAFTLLIHPPLPLWGFC